MSTHDDELSSDLDGFFDETLSDAMTPVELSNEHRDRLRQNIIHKARAVPPVGTRTIRSHEGHWREVMPLVHVKVLRRDRVDGTETTLYRLEPGAVFPPHAHSREEECFVLRGEIETEGHVVRAGDVHIASAGCEHPTVTSRTGALLLIRSQINEFRG